MRWWGWLAASVIAVLVLLGGLYAHVDRPDEGFCVRGMTNPMVDQELPRQPQDFRQPPRQLWAISVGGNMLPGYYSDGQVTGFLVGSDRPFC
jgi:hypothetical protein